jgi:hypothetical protein
MKKTFFEYISMADSEKVHSQTIGWIFSNNCNAISKQDKERILKNLISSKEKLNIEDVFIEIDDIDILIKCSSRLIVIENKVKISQHDNQLEKYENYAKEKITKLNIDPQNISYIYLTLDKEKSNKNPWIDVSYLELMGELNKYPKSESDDTVIFNQYLTTINKILNAINCAIDDKELRSWCFKNTRIKKYDLLKQEGEIQLFKGLKKDENLNNALYLIETGMIRLIQKIFYKRTLDSIDKKFLDSNFSFSEFGASSSTGEGLIQLNFKELFFKYNDIKFNVGYQIQNQTIKINIAHELYNESKNEQLPPDFKELLRKIKSELNFNGRISTGTTKAYGSITKKISFNIPESLTPKDLASYIETDIKASNYKNIISEIFYGTLDS